MVPFGGLGGRRNDAIDFAPRKLGPEPHARVNRGGFAHDPAGGGFAGDRVTALQHVGGRQEAQTGVGVSQAVADLLQGVAGLLAQPAIPLAQRVPALG